MVFRFSYGFPMAFPQLFAFEAPHLCAELRQLHQASAAPRRREDAAGDGGDGDGDHRGGHAGLGHLLHLTWWEGRDLYGFIIHIYIYICVVNK